MTDLERFKEFYSQVGVDIQQVEVEYSDNIIFRIGADRHDDGFVTYSKKFDGYFGFYSDVEFSPDGKFIRQGFWE